MKNIKFSPSTAKYHDPAPNEYTSNTLNKSKVFYQKSFRNRNWKIAQLKNQIEVLEKARSDLKRFFNHYVELFDNAPVGYFILSEEGKILEANLTAADLLKQERNKIINQSFSKFIDDDFKDIWLRHFQKAIKSKGKYGCELPVKLNNLTTHFYHLDCYKKYTEGIKPIIRITLTDVTQRKITEEDLRIAAVAFDAQEAIMVTDNNKIIQRVNKAFTLITGYSAKDVIGKNPGVLRSGLHDDEFYRRMWDFLVEEGYWQGEIWNKRKNGTIFPTWQTITKVLDNNTQTSHYVGSFIDISLQKQTEKNLHKTHDLLEVEINKTQQQLEKTKLETEQVNNLLNYLIKRRDLDKEDSRTAFSREIDAIVMPLIGQLKSATKGEQQLKRLIDILEANLKQVANDYGSYSNLTAIFQKLSPVQAQIASMIRKGLPSKTIASTLNITTGTVNTHRKQIRKKLGLNERNDNLQSYLSNLSE